MATKMAKMATKTTGKSIKGEKNMRGIKVVRNEKGRWLVQRDENKNPSHRLDTQREAIKVGAKMARQAGIPLTIYNCDGDIRRIYKYQQ